MKKIFTLLFVFALIFAAKETAAQGFFTVSGQVLDSLTNEPLAGANVNLNYGDNNAITDKNGKFSLVATKKESVIKYLYGGYGNKKIKENLSPVNWWHSGEDKEFIVFSLWFVAILQVPFSYYGGINFRVTKYR